MTRAIINVNIEFTGELETFDETVTEITKPVDDRELRRLRVEVTPHPATTADDWLAPGGYMK